MARNGYRLTPEWYRYFSFLSTTEADEAGEQPDYRLLGGQSVVVSGLLENGLAVLALQGDAIAPGPGHFYGTDESGAKGWHGLMPRVMARLSMRV